MIKKIVMTSFLIALGASVAQAFQIVSVTHFDLKQPKTHYWEKEQPKVSQGSIIIAQVDPLKFKNSEAQNISVLLGGRILEQVNSGQNKKHLAFISPHKISFSNDKVFVESFKQLPEAVTQSHRINAVKKHAGMDAYSSVAYSRSTLKGSIQLKGEAELYKKTGEILLKFDPSAENFVRNW